MLPVRPELSLDAFDVIDEVRTVIDKKVFVRKVPELDVIELSQVAE